ncbi:DinB family protein [Cytophagaceae bacterium YF14B1]|uniref:DinB family protein n=1 Tax=Xanthocytophaga flava TaxID=3048013 RepID=A0AAE3QRK4_9BACT|nr:DinB family protein [Xanthocytophaga flavus]MDJ1484182.1 DinB family protein [Xanthocytophaga flavus]
MCQIEILTKQTTNTYEWVNKLIHSIPYNQWENTPAIIESNISWQMGHLLVSFYYHSIMVIVGNQKDVLQSIPLKEYSSLYTDASPASSLAKVNPEVLHKHVLFIQQKSLQILESLSDMDLQKNLEPTPYPHPIAKNKLEAIEWNIHHTMYHCGQIGIIRRVIDKRFDFGLKG